MSPTSCQLSDGVPDADAKCGRPAANRCRLPVAAESGTGRFFPLAGGRCPPIASRSGSCLRSCTELKVGDWAQLLGARCPCPSSTPPLHHTGSVAHAPHHRPPHHQKRPVTVSQASKSKKPRLSDFSTPTLSLFSLPSFTLLLSPTFFPSPSITSHTLPGCSIELELDTLPGS